MKNNDKFLNSNVAELSENDLKNVVGGSIQFFYYPAGSAFPEERIPMEGMIILVDGQRYICNKIYAKCIGPYRKINALSFVGYDDGSLNLRIEENGEKQVYEVVGFDLDF